jgi:tetratricopeptide (TPR) repeat protein
LNNALERLSACSRALITCLLLLVFGIPEASTAGDNTDVGLGDLAEAQALFDKALTLHDQGRYGDAVPDAERTLAIRQKLLAWNDPAVADSLYLLGLIYKDRGRYQEAEQLLVQAESAQESHYGPNDPHVAPTLTLLAWTIAGRFSESEAMYKRALLIEQHTYGADSEQTLGPLDGLAVLYASNGRPESAESYYQKMFDIDKKLGKLDTDDDLWIRMTTYGTISARYTNRTGNMTKQTNT